MKLQHTYTERLQRCQPQKTVRRSVATVSLNAK
jgi:hypothetical protein